MSTPDAALHWLADASRRAGLRDLETLPEMGGLGTLEAWEAVCRACNLSAADLAQHVAGGFRLPLADLAEPQRRVLPLIPESLARRHVVFPLRESDRRIVVATSDPTDVEAEKALAFAAGRTPTFEIAPPDRILRAIDEYYAPEHVVETLLARLGAEEEDEVRVLTTTDPETGGPADVSDGPIGRLASLILHEANREGASDIHLERGRGAGTVRFRVDGVLRTHMQIPMPVLNRLISGIEIFGRLDIANRLRPWDGDAPVQVLEPSSEQPAATREARVLVVDDDEVNRRLMRVVLSRHDLEVTEAADGAAALECLEADPEFSLVVLDLDMPRVSGAEVLDRIRRTRATAALPVIVLTRSGSEEHEIRLMEAGADDYVRKPLDPGRLAARVRAVLHRNRP